MEETGIKIKDRDNRPLTKEISDSGIQSLPPPFPHTVGSTGPVSVTATRMRRRAFLLPWRAPNRIFPSGPPSTRSGLAPEYPLFCPRPASLCFGSREPLRHGSVVGRKHAERRRRRHRHGDRKFRVAHRTPGPLRVSLRTDDAAKPRASTGGSQMRTRHTSDRES
jgi:hypothetical protein